MAAFTRGPAGDDKAAEATKLADGMGTEFSVTPLPGGDGFVMVTTENGLSDKIMGRFAAAPEGPLVRRPVLASTNVPEMSKDKGIFSYAAKAHSWASKRQRIAHQLLPQHLGNSPDCSAKKRSIGRSSFGCH